MDIELLADVKLSLLMKYYIGESIYLFGDEISAKVSSPVKKGLQEIHESSKRIEKKDVDILHSIVAKLIWVEKGGSPDIEPAIFFLCARVTKSTKEDKEKFRRVFKYRKHTIDDKMIMGAAIISQLCTWVDAAHGLHPDLKIHTGDCVSFG